MTYATTYSSLTLTAHFFTETNEPTSASTSVMDEPAIDIHVNIIYHV